MDRLRFQRGPTLANALRGVALTALGVLAQAQAAPPPRLGEGLYRHALGDDFAAITQWADLPPSQQTGGRTDEADLLRSDVLMRYGMDREASEILFRLSDHGMSADARDLAWFKLAKLRYQRGQLPLAEEALARVRGALPAPMAVERSLLQAQLSMARADYRAAARTLQALVDASPDAYLARYNLGVAQIKAGATHDGMATLDALGSAPVKTDEQRVLRDRANVALGFASLQAQQPAAARRYLERVPLQGTESNKALLGYGWAAMDQQAPQSALVPWLALSKRDERDPTVLEAKVAVPYAYAQLNAKGQALQHYGEAIDALERQQRSLDASMAFVRSGRFVESLLALHVRDGGEGWRQDALPDVPHVEHLTGLLAQNGFQEAFKTLLDLRRLGVILQGQRDKADLLRDELAARRQTLAQSQQQFGATDSTGRITALSQRVDAVAADVAQAESRGDGVALADAQQRDQLARLARVQALTQKPGKAPELVQARDRVRLLSGLLQWQLVQDQTARQAQAKQDVASMQDTLAQAKQHQATVKQTLSEATQRLNHFDERLQGLTTRLDGAMPQVASLEAEQQAVIQNMALADLTHQKATLAAYLAQARFAVAKLYDQAADAGGPDSDRAQSRTDNQEAAHAPQP